MQKNNLEIEYIATSELIPYVNNSRTHSDEQITQIASSIKEFGFCNPILIDNENGLIAGHGRLLAAQKLNIMKVPAVRLSGLTETQKKAYIIADNKLALNSDWDFELLKLELESLSDENFNLAVIGFDDEEINNLGMDDDISTNFDEHSNKHIEDEQKNILMIEFDSEYQLQQAYETYSGKGFKCKIIE